MFEALLTQLLTDTTRTSLRLFAPELCLTLGIILLLVARVTDLDRKIPSHWLALWSAIAAFALTWQGFVDFSRGNWPAVPYFTELLVMDQFGLVFRLGLTLFLVLLLTLTVLSGIPDRDDAPDFYTLILGSAVGLLVMGSANHLLMVFLGMEMASVPGYALVGFLKGRRSGSEAALKYVVYGSGSAGVMLYGISLLAGVLGTAELPEIGPRIAAVIASTPESADATLRLLGLAVLMIFVGFAFKLAIVPFHFWAPDAFEGATAEVGAYLSVASKAGALAMFARVIHALSIPDSPPGWNQVQLDLGLGLAVLSAITMTYGNLAAYAQTNLKRLLGYSTIAQGGYLMLPLAAMLVLQSSPEVLHGSDSAIRLGRCLEALLYYLAVYLLMNLAPFATVVFIRNQIFSEELKDYAGLGLKSLGLTIALALSLFSLVGLPPLGGFVAKLFVFISVYDAGRVHWLMWVVFAVGAINTLFSLFYYVRILKVMLLEPRPESARPFLWKTWSPEGVYLFLLTLPLVFPLGIGVEMVSAVVRRAARAFLVS